MITELDAEAIYQQIQHGDYEHRQWLKDSLLTIARGGTVTTTHKTPTNYERLKEFYKAFDPSHEPALWAKLIKEEFKETREALMNGDRVKQLDGVCDLLYVTYGLGVCLELPVDQGFEEVHRSNMTKLGEDGKPIRREDGKILKGPNYDPPHLDEILKLIRVI